MKIFGTFLGTVFGLALLLAMLAGAYFLFKYVVSVFGTLEPQVETLAAIASVVALLCASIVAGGLKAHGQQGDYSIATAEKAKLYERLLFLCCEQLKRQGTGDERAADTELVKFEHVLALQGSAKVISAYVELRRLAEQDKKPGNAVSAPLNALVMEMRGDLGRADFIRKENDLLDLLLGRN